MSLQRLRRSRNNRRFCVNVYMVSRTRVFESSTGLVERVEWTPAHRLPVAEDFSPDFQIAFPYRGMFVWHVGHDAVLSDPNQVLFVKGGEPFRVTEPRPRGGGEVIITPAYSMLREVSEAEGIDLERHPLFDSRSRRATPDLQRRCARLVHHAATRHLHDDLAADEELLGLLRHALRLEPPRAASASTRRLIRRAKEFLDATCTTRIHLSQVAAAVGASPAYLTDAFRRCEGISLQRYVTQLRLARALIELPHVTDLTRLALDLGFCSHSHFTFVFRRSFGCTPSQFRRMTPGRSRSLEPLRLSA
jgi:AraC family transcriptional regulator